MSENDTPAVPAGSDTPPPPPAPDFSGGAVSAPAAHPSDGAGTAVMETPGPLRSRGKRSPDGKWFMGTGRRKASVARVRITPGAGNFIVNKKPMTEYFCIERDRKDIQNVLNQTGTDGKLDIECSVFGGGPTGQCGAIVLGIARALATYDSSLEGVLRENNFLTRDPREVERKKYGQRGARRRFQFSKR